MIQEQAPQSNGPNKWLMMATEWSADNYHAVQMSSCQHEGVSHPPLACVGIHDEKPLAVHNKSPHDSDTTSVAREQDGEPCVLPSEDIPACGVINGADSSSELDDDSDSSDQDEITRQELPKYAGIYVAGTINNGDVNYTVDTGANGQPIWCERRARFDLKIGLVTSN